MIGLLIKLPHRSLTQNGGDIVRLAIPIHDGTSGYRHVCSVPDEEAYHAYSPIFISASFSITYAVAFALSTAVIVHTLLHRTRVEPMRRISLAWHEHLQLRLVACAALARYEVHDAREYERLLQSKGRMRRRKLWSRFHPGTCKVNAAIHLT
jgi:hypothetical protein